MLKTIFSLFGRITLVTVFLVILAGSIVRTTGSGMGCPDWPRCYGYFIPPSDKSALDFMPGKSYSKGIMVIQNDTLWRARAPFTAAESFNRAHWEKYPKHDYARFDVTETWIEYINRLLGALLGLFVLLMCIGSFAYRKQQPIVIALSFMVLFLTLFEAWLGALVVHSNLSGVKITVHMLAALLIVAVIIAALRSSSINNWAIPKNMRPAAQFLGFALLATLIQVYLGTQVREEIDEIAKLNPPIDRSEWIDRLPGVFIIHRSFTLFILALNGFVFYWILSKRELFTSAMRPLAQAGMFILALEIIVGIILAYASVPAWAQPIHLVLASLLFGVQSGLLFRMLGHQSTTIRPA